MKSPEAHQSYTYHVQQLFGDPTIDSQWDKPDWQKVPAARLGNYMGNKPEHFPDVRVKLLYDKSALYLIFHVKDRYVRAVAQQYQDPVFRDSCVEFFFTPEEDLDSGYFNLETNCCGAALFHFQKAPKTEVRPVSESDFRKVTFAHSLPDKIDQEISEPITWTLEYRLPFTILANYGDFHAPQTGNLWRANFFKCADHSSHPHWLTWTPVDFPTPRFHLPEYFGTLEFL